MSGENARRDYVANFVYKWNNDLKNLKKRDIETPTEFVTDNNTLIEQLCQFGGKQLTDFKTKFRRIGSNYESEDVTIHSVLHGHRTIWASEAEKEEYQTARHTQTHPRGVDTNGDIETARFHTLFLLFSILKNIFNCSETIRGSLVDIIITAKNDSRVSFGLQIATAIKQDTGTFGFNKTVKEILMYLNANLMVLLIGMVNDKVAGVYMIPPTPDVKAKLEDFSAKYVAPSLLNRITTCSELNEYLENFRYIHPNFTDGVKGTFKVLGHFSVDFLDLLYNNYHSWVNTSSHFSSLFIDASRRTEWAGNTSFETHVLPLLNFTEDTLHGGRGDKLLDFGEFQLKDERKTLGVDNTIATGWKLTLRKAGKQGLYPSDVNITTAFIRWNRLMTCPGNPEDFIGFVLLPILTESGLPALCPNHLTALALSMSFNIAEWSEDIYVSTDRIGKGTYPADMQSTEGKNGRKTKIRAVFYYKDLTPGSQRLTDLQELYKLFASRRPSAEIVSEDIKKRVDEEKASTNTARKEKRKKANEEKKTLAKQEADAQDKDDTQEEYDTQQEIDSQQQE